MATNLPTYLMSLKPSGREITENIVDDELARPKNKNYHPQHNNLQNRAIPYHLPHNNQPHDDE